MHEEGGFRRHCVSTKKRKSPTGRAEPEDGIERSAEDRVDGGALVIPHVDSMESLEEISVWLGTFRERLIVARENERRQVAGVVQELEAHYRRRRGELA